MSKSLNQATDKITKSVRRLSLRPLTRRPRKAFNKAQYFDALQKLDERALGEDAVMQLRDVLRSKAADKQSANRNDPDRVRKQIQLAKALYAARRISRHEYVLFASFPVESVHDSRIIDGAYEELESISQRLSIVEKTYGLDPDQFWLRGQGPQEHTNLNAKYDAISEIKFVEALEEFDLNDLAEMLRRSRTEYDLLRERGRRSIHHKDEYLHALRDIVIQNEDDARRAAAAEAYRAAVTSLGAGIEALLLLRCLRSPHKASRIAAQLPKRLLPRKINDPRTWTFETFIDVCSIAGWFATVETAIARYNPGGLAHILRKMRNYVHPSKMARERPWAITDEQEYKDALAIYIVLMLSLGGIHLGAK